MAKVLGSITCRFTLRAVPFPVSWGSFQVPLPAGFWASLAMGGTDRRLGKRRSHIFLSYSAFGIFSEVFFFLFLVPPHWADFPSSLDPRGQPQPLGVSDILLFIPQLPGRTTDANLEVASISPVCFSAFPCEPVSFVCILGMISVFQI